MMETCNISKCILSITSPGIHLVPGNDTLARKLARLCNDAGAELKRRRPDQFGFFASLPVPDIDGALEEINRAYEELNCDGVTFETNKHGVYLGDKKLDPVFEELNKRHATVFIHPTTPCMPDGQTVAVPVTLFPRPTYEFFFDTCRAVINLFATSTVSRCPNVTFIIPHMGGAFPPLIDRFSRVGPILGLPGIDPQLSADFVRERLNKQFYFDTAGWPFPAQVHGLLQYVTPERILYGTDFPFTPLRAVIACNESHDEHLPKVFGDDVEKVCRGNARRLLKMK
jgi:6-methylsalicylate decarboxylase